MFKYLQFSTHLMYSVEKITLSFLFLIVLVFLKCFFKINVLYSPNTPSKLKGKALKIGAATSE